MNDYTGKIKVYIYSSLFLTLICSPSLCFISFLFRPRKSGIFHIRPLPVISGALTVASLAFILTAFITPKALLPPPGTLWLCLKACGLGSGRRVFGIPAFRLLASRGETVVSPLLLLFCLVLGALSALYFLLVALRTKKAGSGRVLAGFIPIFWAVVSMSEAYTNKLVAMNNPVKISFMMATLVVMLFMLYELRYLLERGFPRAFWCSRWPQYLFWLYLRCRHWYLPQREYIH